MVDGEGAIKLGYNDTKHVETWMPSVLKLLRKLSRRSGSENRWEGNFRNLIINKNWG